MLDIHDGACEPDIVMKKFIDFIKNKDPTRSSDFVLTVSHYHCHHHCHDHCDEDGHYTMIVASFNMFRFRSTIGILGPACSDTVEPIAGVSKHFKTVVISYRYSLS